MAGLLSIFKNGPRPFDHAAGLRACGMGVSALGGSGLGTFALNGKGGVSSVTPLAQSPAFAVK